ncbi:hypothetical protein AFB00_04890 [Pseudonocardia sp. HH130630-07]|nr:hypothetical protein AFB00_04890 [Pseudonocardia sp. HH130630-07]
MAEPTEECTTSEDGTETACIRRLDPEASAQLRQSAAPSMGARYPTCRTPRQIYFFRDEVCANFAYSYVLTRTVNGTPTVVGRADFETWRYSYTSADLANWSHELGMEVVASSGEAVGATLDGFAVAGGACSTGADSTIGGVGLGTGKQFIGTGNIRSNSTEIGSWGYCSANWTVSATAPSGVRASITDWNEPGVRCDNYLSYQTRRPGCVVPQYPEAVSYDALPDLANHVLQAQQSGLPGATVDNPLVKADDATTARNRQLACGDAPSIAGRSCDEYPVATSKQGLTAGGERRTFDQCSFPNIGAGSGASGVSVCMVPERQQFSQGGLNSAFFREWRVFVDDPFRVVVR